MRRSSLACVLALPLLLSPLAVRAQDVLPPKTLVRRFPQGFYCPLPVAVTFTAPATPITITFTATVYVDDGHGVPTWTAQSIDNVTLAASSVVTPNIAPPPAGSSLESCYIGDPLPTPYFHFNRAGLAIDLLERFDTNPAGRGWDLAHGGYFNTARSALRNVETATDATGGSLGIGPSTTTPVIGATASSSISVAGLVEGASYDLGAWWDAQFVRFPFDTNYLTISITTVEGTPVVQRSWGALKSAWR